MAPNFFMVKRSYLTEDTDPNDLQYDPEPEYTANEFDAYWLAIEYMMEDFMLNRGISSEEELIRTKLVDIIRRRDTDLKSRHQQVWDALIEGIGVVRTGHLDLYSVQEIETVSYATDGVNQSDMIYECLLNLDATESQTESPDRQE